MNEVGISVLIKHTDSLEKDAYEAIFIKETSIDHLTNFGGYRIDENESDIDAAVRCTNEQICGSCSIANQVIDGTKLLDINREQLHKVATVHFHPPFYYEIPVKEYNYKLFGTCVSDDCNLMIKALVEESELYYIEHKRTNYICLEPLHPELLDNTDAILSITPKDVSPLHWILAHANLASILKRPFSMKNVSTLFQVKSIMFR